MQGLILLHLLSCPCLTYLVLAFRQGFNHQGFNKEGMDKDGYDKDGLNKEGYNRCVGSIGDTPDHTAD